MYTAISEEDAKEKMLIEISELENILSESTFLVSLKGVDHPMQSEQFTQKKEGNFTFKASFSETTGELYLYVTNGYVYGNIHIDSLAYQIEPISKKYALLLRRDYSGTTCPLGEEHEDERKSKDTSNNGLGAHSTSSTNPVIDVMVVFSNQAAAATADMEALALGSIQSSNTTFSNSNAGVTFNLVHYQQISYSENTYMDYALDDLIDPSDGIMDNVHSLRDQFNADVVVLIVDDGLYSISGQNLCGIVDYINVNSADAYAVVADNCSIGNYTFAHEIGHLAGARHDNDGTGSPYAYGHGFRYLPAYWRTVMGIRNYTGDPTNRIPYWSNPDKYYGGVAMGSSSWRDNARVWDVRAGSMANFRTSASQFNFEISGGDYFNYGNFGIWSANVSSGASPYNFTWYRSYTSSTGPWSTVGNGTNYAQTVTHDMWLKLYGTDSNSNSHEDILKVNVLTCSSPPCPIPKVIGQEPQAIPEVFGIAQNYPNPFNPSTNIRFELPEASTVTISVFNLMGQEVANLVNQKMEAGSYTQNFEASNLSSGFYFARIEAVGTSGEIFTKSITMQLIK
jgi:hypothetical protein